MKINTATLATLIAVTVSASALGQSRVTGSQRTVASGFAVGLSVPSHVGADVQADLGSADASGLVPTANRPSEVDSYTVSFANNEDGGRAFVSRIVVGVDVSKGGGVSFSSSRGASSPDASARRTVVSETTATIAKGMAWNSSRESLSQVIGATANTAGKAIEPELIVYEFGNL